MASNGRRSAARSLDTTREASNGAEPERTGDNVIPLVETACARARARSALAREEQPEPAGDPAQLDLLVDGRRVTVEANRELVLRCGKASITLTRAGKIILRGTHVVSRSSGSNRVQGTQVRIN